jgi:predicted transcriptional regulator of viral defense system
MKKLEKISIKGLSKREVEIIAWLEFNKKYFFTIADVAHFFKNKKQRYNFIQKLIHKKRILKLNREKYYLVPIKAKSGKWIEEPFVVIDEMLNGKAYYIGGWGAANYWRLTDQIPFRFDVYTTRRQGKFNVLNAEITFHRSTKESIKNKGVIQNMQNHEFTMQNKEETEKWMKLRK